MPTTLLRELIHDQLVVINDEMLPSELGVMTGPGAAAAAASNSGATDRESLNKAKQTSGWFASSTFTTNESGRRVHENKKIICRAAYWGASNVGKHQIQSAMNTRHHIEEIAKTQRHVDDNGGIEALLLQQLTPEQRVQWEEICDRLKLTQMRKFFVWKMIKRGIFHAVDMTAANVLILNVLRRAKEMGLKTDELRSMDRLRMCVEALVVWDAIDLVFDSESSSLKDRTWNPHHLIEVEKHLVAKKRHVSLAFGLCASQWEDPMRQKVQNAIVQYVRKNTTKVVLNPSLASQGVGVRWLSSAGDGQPARLEHTDAHAPALSNYVSCPHGLGKNNKAKTRPHNKTTIIIATTTTTTTTTTTSTTSSSSRGPRTT